MCWLFGTCHPRVSWGFLLCSKDSSYIFSTALSGRLCGFACRADAHHASSAGTARILKHLCCHNADETPLHALCAHAHSVQCRHYCRCSSLVSYFRSIGARVGSCFGSCTTCACASAHRSERRLFHLS